MIANLIREARIRQGMSQATLVEKIGIERERISKYERGVNIPPITMIVEIFEVLNTRLMIDKGSIIAEGMIEDMNSCLITNYRLFNVENYKKHIFEQEMNGDAAKLDFQSRINKLKKENFHLKISDDSFKEKYLKSTQNRKGCRLTLTHALNDKLQIEIINQYETDIEFFDFSEFIEDISKQHSKDVAAEIEKAIMYTCCKEGTGTQLLYWIRSKKDITQLLSICPYLKRFEKVFCEQLQRKYYIKRMTGEGYEIRRDKEFLLANHLGLAVEYSYSEWEVICCFSQGMELNLSKYGYVELNAALDVIIEKIPKILEIESNGNF